MPFDAHGSVQGNPVEQPVMKSTASEAPAPQAPETPAPAPKAPEPVSPPPAPGAPAPDAGTEKPPFQPSYKFNVRGKEHEIAEAFRGIIKDPDTEKLVKELHEKAYGLDAVKPKFQELKTRYEQVESKAQQFEQGISELREHYRSGDFDSFFQKLNIPQEKVLQWVLDKAHYNELPPEQRQVLDAKRAAEAQARSLEKEKSQLQKQYEETLVQARARDLQVALAKDDVRTFAEHFESQRGEGKFLEEVIEAGEAAWYLSKGKVELSPEEAIQKVMERYSGFLKPQATQAPIIPVQGALNPGQPQAKATVSPPKSPTLPNLSGRQTSSVSKSKPKSIDDLKELYRKMSQRG